MRRILFVDDEPRILDGLRRMLHSQRREWEMVFAVGAPAALAQCEQQPFDVVITDMRMPGMDGATLLTEVRDRYPDTVRVVLSGYTDRDAAARALRVAHQFLMKPSNAEAVREAIDRAFALQTQIDDHRIRELLGAVDRLPPVPRLYLQIVEALERPEVSIDAVGELITQDVAISAKLLQLVNSSFFGYSREVTSLPKAVRLLGVNLIKHLVLSLEVFQSFELPGSSPVPIERLQRHSVRVAKLTSTLFPGALDRDQAYTAGLLHDTGKLLLSSFLPDEYARIRSLARENEIPEFAAEREVVGTTHAQVGAYLLGLWHLPVSIVEAVAYHHEPAKAHRGKAAEAFTAVHIADALLHEAGGGTYPSPSTPLDREHVESLGLSDELPHWRGAAQALVHSEEE